MGLGKTVQVLALLVENRVPLDEMNPPARALRGEALRLALIHHKSLATGLKGIQQERTISDVFEQRTSGKTLIDLLKLDLIVGSGGILSHAPRRVLRSPISGCCAGPSRRRAARSCRPRPRSTG